MESLGAESGRESMEEEEDDDKGEGEREGLWG